MDKIMSLSAFGDEINPEMKGEETPQEPTQVDQPTTPSYSVVFSKILQNTSQSKLLHWQSALYGQHKALDKLFEGLADLGDTLAETIMGKYGRPTLNDDELCLKLKNFESPEAGDLSEFMDHLYNCYSSECRSLFDPSKDSEIINILDEILSLVDKTKYLLSLR
jgi:DNA-binding ferritin-like protein